MHTFDSSLVPHPPKPPRRPIKALALHEELFRKAPDGTREKASFVQAIQDFAQYNVHKRGHVDFIYLALRKMREYGVERDLAVYNLLLDIFPKEVFRPRSIFQTIFYHYPRQQECGIAVLEQMENHGQANRPAQAAGGGGLPPSPRSRALHGFLALTPLLLISQSVWLPPLPTPPRSLAHPQLPSSLLSSAPSLRLCLHLPVTGVMPNKETEFLLIQIFGRKSYPMLKYVRMKLWFTRFRNINPFPLPRDLPQDPVDLARLALRHMEPDLSARVTVYQVSTPVHTLGHLPVVEAPFGNPK